MDSKQYKIRKAFMFPLGLTLFLCIALLALSVFQNETPPKLVVLSLMVLSLGIFFLESLFRRIVIDKDSITHFKFLRQKTMLFAHITSFESMSLRKRVFSTLTSEESFLIFTNAYGNYADLTREILARLPEKAVSPETRELASSPPVKHGDVISFWVTAIILGAILLQLASAYFK
jgi:hypothetical protein